MLLREARLNEIGEREPTKVDALQRLFSSEFERLSHEHSKSNAGRSSNSATKTPSATKSCAASNVTLTWPKPG
jgi:hypothetical protein